MFLGYLIGDDGAVYEVFDDVVDSSAGALLQGFGILALMGISVISAIFHFQNVIHCFYHMPFFYIMVVFFLIFNLFNGARVINGGGFRYFLSTVMTGGLVGGILFSLCLKPYYLEYIEYKPSFWDGIGRFGASMFFVIIIGIISLLIGMLVSKLLGFDGDSGTSKAIFALLMVGFIVASIFSIKSARGIADENLSSDLEKYYNSQIEKIDSLDYYDDYVEIVNLYKETIDDINSYSGDNSYYEGLIYERYNDYLHKHDFFLDAMNTEGNHDSFLSDLDNHILTITQNFPKVELTYKANGEFDSISGTIVASKNFDSNAIDYYKPNIKIYADDKCVYTSPKLSKKSKEHFKVKVNKAEKIRIEAVINNTQSLNFAYYEIQDFYAYE